MPGFPRWRWSNEPFSYTKLCYLVPLLVFAPAAFFPAFERCRWLPSSNVLRVATVGLIALGAYYFFLKVVWKLLPARVRERTPYDLKEAVELKGDVRSFRDFCKVLLCQPVHGRGSGGGADVP